jgi:FHA domain
LNPQGRLGADRVPEGAAGSTVGALASAGAEGSAALTTTAPQPAGPAGAASGPLLLGLVELLDRDGRVRAATPISRWPVSLGRALDNTVVVDDPHVAPYHARIATSGHGAIELQALSSINGIALATRRLREGERMPLAANAPPCELTLGTTRLRVRLAGEKLAVERALPNHGAPRTTVVLIALLWLWQLVEHAVGTDPGGKLSEWITPILSVPLALGGWCLLWALASKIFQHRFDFWLHLAVAARWLLLIEVVGFVLPWASGVTGWALPSRLAGAAVAALGLAWVWSHARWVLPQQRKPMAVLAAVGFAVSAAVLGGLNWQRQDRWFSELYTAQLPPPSLLWSRPAAPEDFLREATELQAPLERAVREAAAEQKADGGDADDE